MKYFSINDIEKFSGIKAATLRMWEKRYGIANPARTEYNDRVYDVNLLETFLDIAILKNNGWKISVLSSMTKEALKQKIDSLTHRDDTYLAAINRLTICMFKTDIEEFEAILDAVFKKYSVSSALLHIIIPFFEKVNMLSYTSSDNEMHIAVSLIRKKIIYEIERLKPETKNLGTALLFLPQDEHYDLMLLCMYYILKERGLKIIYLGTNIPEQNIISMLKNKKPEYIFTYLAEGNFLKFKKMILNIQEELAEQKFGIVGDRKSVEMEAANINAVNYIPYNQLSEMIQTA
ncbi:MerR family transcriptional regulator [Aridibaculum aurantiacum]|uniref:MerR family transcriptional regulator n=1 Tax=Aridibaculum aurantiacum TaxID=2810307 RepID=UPI001A95FD80|nr:MerR family transcriptional regulator [Aridibaculum aurantiacum]